MTKKELLQNHFPKPLVNSPKEVVVPKKIVKKTEIKSQIKSQNDINIYREYYDKSKVISNSNIKIPDFLKDELTKKSILNQYSSKEQPHAIIEMGKSGTFLLYPGAEMKYNNATIRCLDLIQGNDIGIKGIFEIEKWDKKETIALNRFDNFADIKLIGMTPPQSKSNMPFVTFDLVNSSGNIIDIIKANPGDSVGGLRIKNINNDFALYNLGVELLYKNPSNNIVSVRLGESVQLNDGSSLRVREVGTTTKNKVSFNIELNGEKYSVISKEGEETLAYKMGSSNLNQGFNVENDYVIIKPKLIISGPTNVGKEEVIFDVTYSINGKENKIEDIKLEKGKIHKSDVYNVGETSFYSTSGTILRIEFESASYGINY